MDREVWNSQLTPVRDGTFATVRPSLVQAQLDRPRYA